MASLLDRIRFRVALWVWARWLPVLARRRDLKPLVEKAMPPPGIAYRGLQPAYIVKRVRRAVRRPWLMRDRSCLREGLLAYRFLSLAGYRPELHFGVERASVGASRLSAHCWVVLDGRVILNAPVQDMAEILEVRADDRGNLQFRGSDPAGAAAIVT